MTTTLAGAAKKFVNAAISPLGIKLVRNQHDWSDTRNFIPFAKTIDAAKQRGLAVGDYIDTVMNKTPGVTQRTVEEMARLGVFAGRVETVVEIGPGSGRYLERTQEHCSGCRYEVYETSPEWAKYVVEKYRVVWQPTDGKSLAATTSDSIDLAHAHKVFPGSHFLVTAKYWAEMLRVTRSGAHIVFDLITERCLDVGTLRNWIASNIENGAYPAVVPRTVAVSYFEAEGCDLIGTFIVPIGNIGQTEVFVFRKR